MIVGKLIKETTDIRRAVVDFIKFLDAGETITAISTPTIIVDYSPFSGGKAPVDVTPLTIVSAGLTASATGVTLFIGDGTPTLTYVISFVATCGSGRAQTVEITMVIAASPSASTITVANIPSILAGLPTTLPSLPEVLWNNAGVLSVS